MAKGVTSKKVKNPKLSNAEKALAKIQTDHRSNVRGIFTQAGFVRVAGIADKQFTFDNQQGDVDDIFVYENVVILAEYTCTKTDEIGKHLKLKKLLFDKILRNKAGFIEFISQKFPDTKTQLSEKYHKTQIVVKIVYCSRYEFDEHYKTNVPGPMYLDYPSVRYFMALIDSIKRSARWELLHFLEIPNASVGKDGAIGHAETYHDRKGLILPEAHSNFDDGYKVVTFYT